MKIYNWIKGLISNVENYLLYGGYNGPSVAEIADGMRPVPYSEIEHKLPNTFARAVREIIESEDAKKGLETKL